MKKREIPAPPRRSPSNDPFGTWRRPVDPVSLRQAPSRYDQALSLAAVAWLGELPQEVAPLALANQFPRIVNRLSRFWDSPRMIESYFEELLVNKRSRRQGFTKKVLDELQALAQYHRHLHDSPSSDLWDAIPYRRREDI